MPTSSLNILQSLDTIANTIESIHTAGENARRRTTQALCAIDWAAAIEIAVIALLIFVIGSWRICRLLAVEIGLVLRQLARILATEAKQPSAGASTARTGAARPPAKTSRTSRTSTSTSTRTRKAAATPAKPRAKATPAKSRAKAPAAPAEPQPKAQAEATPERPEQAS